MKTDSNSGETFAVGTENDSGASARSIHRLLLRGGLTLGFAVALERGFNFSANLLAARFAGPEMFGTYALVLVTAGTVATYTGAGIGATANRFGGQHGRDTKEHRQLLRALLTVSFVSAAAAAVLLFVGAAPIARYLLRNDNLTFALRLAALSAAVMILLECGRGLLIGQQKFSALLLFSFVLGLGLLIALPAATLFGAEAMIVSQAGVGLLAVAVCVLFARRLGITPSRVRRDESEDAARGRSADAGEQEQSPAGVGAVFVFGLMQLGSVITLNLAGWWITSLIVRGDATLFQLGIYAVANQLRQLAHIFPDLLTRICFPLLTEESGAEYGGHDRVLLINSFVATCLSLGVAGIAVIVLPWALRGLYGPAYAAGEMPCALLLATAVVHMSGAPGVNRLNIIALRAVGIVNLLWTAALVGLGFYLVPKIGATGAAAAFLVTHVFSESLILLALERYRALPGGLVTLSVMNMGGALLLAGGALVRAEHPEHAPVLTVALGAIFAATMFVVVRFGQRRDWMPQLPVGTGMLRSASLDFRKRQNAQ